MIKFQLTTASTPDPKAWMELNFMQAVVEASRNNLFKNSGSVNDPFNLDSFILWKGVDRISNLEVKDKLFVDFTDQIIFQSPRLIQGFMIKITNPNTIWPKSSPDSSDETWEKYFAWASGFGNDVNITSTGEAVFDMTSQSFNPSKPLIFRTDANPPVDIYFSFGFIFSYQVSGDPRTFFGSVDPLVKITSP